MNTVKCAVIGLGAIHKNHIEALRQLDSVRLAAVCDVDEALLLQKQEEFCCPGYTDYREMICKEQPDVVHICTPHYLHAPMAIFAMEHGVDVLTEKPMGMDPSQTRAMIETAERTGRRLGVCFQNRYNPTSVRIREVLDSGRAGAVRSIKMVVTWNRDAAYYAQAAWRGTRSMEGGGVMINQAIHTLDLLQWYAGFPTDVQAQTACFRLQGEIEVEDTAHGYLHFPSGASGIFYATNDFGADAPIELDLVCEHARIQLKDALDITYDDGTVEHLDNDSLAAGPKGYWGTGHTRLIADFYEKRAQGLPFPIDGREGEKAIRLIDAVYRSAAAGGLVMEL